MKKSLIAGALLICLSASLGACGYGEPWQEGGIRPFNAKDWPPQRPNPTPDARDSVAGGAQAQAYEREQSERQRQHKEEGAKRNAEVAEQSRRIVELMATAKPCEGISEDTVRRRNEEHPLTMNGVASHIEGVSKLYPSTSSDGGKVTPVCMADIVMSFGGRFGQMWTFWFIRESDGEIHLHPIYDLVRGQPTYELMR